MKGIILVGSVAAAILIILTSLASVVGVQSGQTDTGTTQVSPLFARRITSALQKSTTEIQSNYIGKGAQRNLFFSDPSLLRVWVDRAVKIIDANPALVHTIFDRIQKLPYVIELLQKNKVSSEEFKQQLSQLENDPALLKQYMQQVKISVDASGDSGEPLGLDTSNAIGCFITVLVLLPVAIMLALLIATITIVTCLNLGGCFEKIAEQILENIVQRLTPPDS